jgi:secreted Zn-dependent insulinase-like peptidase
VLHDTWYFFSITAVSVVSFPVLSLDAEWVDIEMVELTNHLQGSIFSDRLATDSGFAFVMGVGAWSDPEVRLGMAHLAEHAILQNSKGSAFLRALYRCGGTFRAFTGADKTIYAFSVPHNFLPNAVLKFASLLNATTFNDNSIAYSVNVIDKEWRENCSRAVWNKWASLQRVSSPHHPFARLSTGNAHTLQGVTPAELSLWYTENYSASRGWVLLYSNASVEDLKALFIEGFHDIPSRDTTIPKVNMPLLQNGPTYMYLEPSEQNYELSVYWHVPAGTFFSDYSACLVAHELEEAIKKDVGTTSWVQKVKCGITSIASHTSLLQCTLDLTKDGKDYIEQIVDTLFTSVDMLSHTGIDERSNEIFRANYTASYSPRSYKNTLDFTLHAARHNSIFTHIYGGYEIEKESREDIQAVLDSLSREFAVITIPQQ